MALSKIVADSLQANAVSEIALGSTGVTAGTYGNTTAIPVITVDADGRITNATTNSVSGVTGLSYTNANTTVTVSTSTVNYSANIESGLNQAYSNAVSVAATDATNKASNAYSNAIAYAASNTYVNNTFAPLAGATFTGNVTANNIRTTGSVQIDGDLTVSGNTVQVNVTNLSLEDNMIYLNANNTVSHPDLGIAGNYNDGTYRHAGFFRDATDARWKFFDQYQPEPDASPYIDTSNNTFRIADIQANVVYGVTFTGTANNASYLGGQLPAYYANSTAPDTAYSNAVSYAATIAGTAYSNAVAYAASNTYVNTQLGLKASLSGATFSGAVSGITTLAAGNTTLTNSIWNMELIPGSGGGIIQASNVLRLRTNGGTVEGLYITGTGNTGIGNLSPAHTLSVNGNGYFGSSLQVAGHFTGTTGAFSSYLTTGSTVSADPGANYYSFTHRLGGSLAVSNNIAIGSNAAIGTLHVRGPYVYLDKSGTAEPTIRFRSSNDSYAQEWGVGHRASSNDFAFRWFDGTSTWNERVAFAANGNVGIGVAAPRAPLDLGSQNNRGQVILLGETSSNVRVGLGLDSSTAGMRLFTYQDSGQMVDIGGISGTDGTTWTRHHRFGIAGGNSWLNENGGNVGIGTTSPGSSKLTIVANNSTYNQTTGSHLRLENTSGSQSLIGFTYNGTAKGSIRVDSGGNMVLSANQDFYFNYDLGPSTIVFRNGGSNIFQSINGTAVTFPGSVNVSGSSISGTGYTKLVNGLIIQWGSSYAPNDGKNTYNFPIAFPNGCYGFGTGNDWYNQNGWAPAGGYPISASQYVVWGIVEFGYTVYWIAIGY